MKKRLFLLSSLFLLFASVTNAQQWEEKHRNLLRSYEAKYGLPALNGDAARAWTRRLAEQFKFSFPNEGWGHKAGGGGRPPSTDVIARQMSNGLWGYDLILNQGISSQEMDYNPGAINLAGQEFIPVTATNHLGNVVEPEPQIPPVDTKLQARVEALEKELASLKATFGGYREDVTRQFEQVRIQHFELSDYAHGENGKIFERLSLIESKPIPTGCVSSVVGLRGSCSLKF